jgi:hypothetical protein
VALIKTILKLALAVAVVAAVAGVVSVLRGSRPVTVEEWPEVPTRPAS